MVEDFTLPHIFHSDSTRVQWNPPQSSGIHQSPVESTRVQWHPPESSGVQWTLVTLKMTKGYYYESISHVIAENASTRIHWNTSVLVLESNEITVYNTGSGGVR